jgi:hypothetical protein
MWLDRYWTCSVTYVHQGRLLGLGCAVLALEVIEHLDNPVETLAECRRLVRPQMTRATMA